MNIKLESILEHYAITQRSFNQIGNEGWEEQKEKAIAAIKQAFLEMDSMQDVPEIETWIGGHNTLLDAQAENDVRRAIRNDVNGE